MKKTKMKWVLGFLVILMSDCYVIKKDLQRGNDTEQRPEDLLDIVQIEDNASHLDREIENSKQRYSRGVLNAQLEPGVLPEFEVEVGNSHSTKKMLERMNSFEETFWLEKSANKVSNNSNNNNNNNGRNDVDLFNNTSNNTIDNTWSNLNNVTTTLRNKEPDIPRGKEKKQSNQEELHIDIYEEVPGLRLDSELDNSNVRQVPDLTLDGKPDGENNESWNDIYRPNTGRWHSSDRDVQLDNKVKKDSGFDIDLTIDSERNNGNGRGTARPSRIKRDTRTSLDTLAPNDSAKTVKPGTPDDENYESGNDTNGLIILISSTSDQHVHLDHKVNNDSGVDLAMDSVGNDEKERENGRGLAMTRGRNNENGRGSAMASKIKGDTRPTLNTLTPNNSAKTVKSSLDGTSDEENYESRNNTNGLIILISSTSDQHVHLDHKVNNDSGFDLANDVKGHGSPMGSKMKRDIWPSLDSSLPLDGSPDEENDESWNDIDGPKAVIWNSSDPYEHLDNKVNKDSGFDLVIDSERNDEHGRGSAMASEGSDENGRGSAMASEGSDENGRGLPMTSERNDEHGRGLAMTSERNDENGRGSAMARDQQKDLNGVHTLVNDSQPHTQKRTLNTELQLETKKTNAIVNCLTKKGKRLERSVKEMKKLLRIHNDDEREIETRRGGRNSFLKRIKGIRKGDVKIKEVDYGSEEGVTRLPKSEYTQEVAIKPKRIRSKGKKHNFTQVNHAQFKEEKANTDRDFHVVNAYGNKEDTPDGIWCKTVTKLLTDKDEYKVVDSRGITFSEQTADDKKSLICRSETSELVKPNEDIILRKGISGATIITQDKDPYKLIGSSYQPKSDTLEIGSSSQARLDSNSKKNSSTSFIGTHDKKADSGSRTRSRIVHNQSNGRSGLAMESISDIQGNTAFDTKGKAPLVLTSNQEESGLIVQNPKKYLYAQGTNPAPRERSRDDIKTYVDYRKKSSFDILFGMPDMQNG